LKIFEFLFLLVYVKCTWTISKPSILAGDLEAGGGCVLAAGEETKYFEALRSIMGHIDASMSGQYREGVSAERLAAVSDYVRKWLVGSA
jgi:hypothetical protein